MSAGSPSRRFPLGGYEALCAFALLALSLWVLGPGSAGLGFYADDVNFLEWLPGRGIAATIDAARTYVPGRELHILWQQLLFVLCGSGPDDLPRLHLVQSALDGAVCGTLFALLRLIPLPTIAAFAGSLLFLFYPNHGETHFWLSSAPMNIVSTGLLTGYIACVVVALRGGADGMGGYPTRVVLAAEPALFVCAIFTYDQGLFVALAAAAVRCVVGFARCGWKNRAVLLSSAFYVVVSLAYLLHKTGAEATSGPFLSMDSLRRLRGNGATAMSLTFGAGLRDGVRLTLTRSDTDVWLGTMVAVGVVCLGVFVVLIRAIVDKGQRPSGSADSRTRTERLRLGTALIAAAAGYALSYLPACLWHIAPRHHYLPTLFVCAGAAILLAWLILELAALRRIVRIAVLLTVCTAVAGAAAVGAACGASEKSVWSDNYRLRSAFYLELGRAGLLNGKKALSLDGFPGYYHGSTFFAYESVNGGALHYLLPETRVALQQFALNAFPGTSGAFLHTEQARFGGVNIRYFPAAEVLQVKFVAIDGRRIRWVTTEPSVGDRWRVGFSTGSPSQEEPAPMNATLLSLLAFSQDRNGSLSFTRGSQLRGAVPPRGEAVACLLSFADAGADANREFVPFVEQKEPHGPNYLVLPLLERRDPADRGPAGELEGITIPVERSIAAVKVGCYRCSSGPPTLLGERVVPVTR